jgi:pyruvate formate lyase activating enzyme
MQGLVFDIAEASIHDGPGLRITVFLKGCPLRCRWCHSPEGQSPAPELLTFPGGQRLAGEVWSPRKLAEYLLDKKDLLDGVTFSGGEPLSQADFLLEVLDLTKNALPSIIDTSCHGDYQKLKTLAEKAESLHVGLKVLDNEKARHWTGQGSALILENIRRLDKECATPYCFRLPLIPNVTDSEENLTAVANLAKELKNLTSVDFLPYNPASGGKYAACGRAFDPGFDENAPTLLDLAAFRKLCPVEARVLE